MRLVSRDITWLLFELIGGVPEEKGNNESWSGVFEVEAGADEKQQIKFVWPYNNYSSQVVYFTKGQEPDQTLQVHARGVKIFWLELLLHPQMKHWGYTYTLRPSG